MRISDWSSDVCSSDLAHYDGLSRRLQQIARYVLDHPNEVALETLAVIAQRADVQPSAIVRFAKGFGFAGASQMQRLFRDGLLSENAALGYGERVRQRSEEHTSELQSLMRISYAVFRLKKK